MANKCYKCNTNEAGVAGVINHPCGPYTLALYKDSIECASCVKKGFAEKFERYSKNLVGLVQGKYRGDAGFDNATVNIDWEYFWYFVHGISDKNAPIAKAAHEMTEVLISLGVFSYEARHNWDIQVPGAYLLNPWLGCKYLYFTCGDDAIEYARVAYSNTARAWSIRRYSEIVNKEDVFRQAVRI